MHQIKKIILSVTVSAAALALSPATFASVKASTGVLFGAQLGYSFLDVYPTTISGQTSKLSKKPFAWGVLAGYDYAFSDTLQAGIEIGYHSYGIAQYGPIKFSQAAADLLVKAAYVSSTGLNTFVKGGIARMYRDIITSSATSTTYNDLKKFKPEIAIGLGYIFADNINVYVSYDHLFGGDKDDLWNNPQSVNLVMAGVSYTFTM